MMGLSRLAAVFLLVGWSSSVRPFSGDQVLLETEGSAAAGLATSALNRTGAVGKETCTFLLRKGFHDAHDVPSLSITGFRIEGKALKNKHLPGRGGRANTTTNELLESKGYQPRHWAVILTLETGQGALFDFEQDGYRLTICSRPEDASEHVWSVEETQYVVSDAPVNTIYQAKLVKEVPLVDIASYWVKDKNGREPATNYYFTSNNCQDFCLNIKEKLCCLSDAETSAASPTFPMSAASAASPSSPSSPTVTDNCEVSGGPASPTLPTCPK